MCVHVREAALQLYVDMWAVAVCVLARSAEKNCPVILRAVKSTLRISKVVKCSGQIPAVKCGQIFPPNKKSTTRLCPSLYTLYTPYAVRYANNVRLTLY